MKTISFFVLFLFAIAVLQAQDYQISFTGSGQSTTIDSIQIENLTQGITLSLNGDDVLHLVGTVGINILNANKNTVKVYPNPMVESAFVEFVNSKTELVYLEIYNEMGVLIAKQGKQVQQGRQRFKISGLNAGIYTIYVNAADWKYAAKLISLGKISGNTAIEHQGTAEGTTPENVLKSRNNLVQMQYNDGEMILFKGFAGNYARVLTLLPTQSQTVSFEFIPCSDGDGKNYAVVTIGTQIWMAENLNYETSNSWWYNNSSVNGAIYGRLYKWGAALTACPSGWHLPSDDEWKMLEMYLGMSQSEAEQTGWRGTDEGGKMKETGTAHWNSPNTGATNSIGFTALPGGLRQWGGDFDNLGGGGNWWTSSEKQAGATAWTRGLSYSSDKVFQGYDIQAAGYSVRCVRD